MGKNDKRIDAYIETSADFARPILTHMRKLVHIACPDVEETMKWSFPHFDYHGIMCAMAGFKQHCTFGFWKASIMSDPNKLFSKTRDDAMGHFGQLKKLSDLPSDKILIAYIKEAARLNSEGIKLPPRPKAEKKVLRVPDYLKKALKKNKKALATFEGFSYSNKKEYVEWLTEAKTDETRDTRLATAIQWMAEGKVRNWKYLKK